MGTIVYEEMVIAVQLQEIKPQHETLQDGVCLEGDDAIQVPFVLWLQHCAVYLPVLKRQEVVLALRRHVVWNESSASKFVSHLRDETRLINDIFKAVMTVLLKKGFTSQAVGDDFLTLKMMEV